LKIKLEFHSRFKNDAESSTGLLFIRAYNKWHALIKKALRKLGITHPQFVVLTSLNFLSQSDDSVSQVNIARMAEMDVMSVSQILRGLEEKGFVKRISNPKDSRANIIVLLPKGQEIAKSAVPIVEQIDDVFFGILKDSESEFRNFLKTIDAVDL
jgi:DNA-binding MarR family transcriptional regulator